MRNALILLGLLMSLVFQGCAGAGGIFKAGDLGRRYSCCADSHCHHRHRKQIQEIGMSLQVKICSFVL